MLTRVALYTNIRHGRILSKHWTELLNVSTLAVAEGSRLLSVSITARDDKWLEGQWRLNYTRTANRCHHQRVFFKFHCRFLSKIPLPNSIITLRSIDLYGAFTRRPRQQYFLLLLVLIFLNWPTINYVWNTSQVLPKMDAELHIGQWNPRIKLDAAYCFIPKQQPFE